MPKRAKQKKHKAKTALTTHGAVGAPPRKKAKRRAKDERAAEAQGEKAGKKAGKKAGRKAGKKAGKKAGTQKRPAKSTASTALPEVLSCGVLLIQRQGPAQLVLSLLRHDGTPDLPKGHKKRGETDLQTALRECTEETGIAATRVCIDDTFSFEARYRTKSKKTRLPVMKTVRLFLGEVAGPVEVKVSDHRDYAWLRLDDEVALERELRDNQTFLGGVTALWHHQQQPTTLRPTTLRPTTRR